jgi:protein-disulfide isomerase
MSMKANFKTHLMIASLAALAVAGCKGNDAENATVSSATNVVAPGGQNWVETVAMTEATGYLMGNPNAPVKLVEYGALSCPTCAQFSVDSTEKLKKYVAKGTVSMEFRPFFVHPQDLPATLLAGCNGPAPFFMIAEQMFADQRSWAYSREVPAELQQQWSAGGPTNFATQMATYLGMQDFVAKRGVTADKAKACLADKAAVEKLSALQERGMKEGVQGTPTFFVNSVRADVNNWADLEPILVKAGG